MIQIQQDSQFVLTTAHLLAEAIMRIIVLLIISLLVSGCSSQFAYRNLDWIIAWYSDDYLDLNRQQAPIFEGELSKLLAWHQTSELPKYRLHLQSASNDLNTLPLTDAVIEHNVATMRQHWLNMRLHLSKQLPPLASNLSPQQVNGLFSKLDTRIQERLDDYLALTADEAKTEQQEKLEDRLNEWLGSITDTQQLLISAFIQQQDDSTRERMAYLRTYQAKLKQAMQPPINEGALQTILNTPDDFKSLEYKNKQDKNRLHIRQFIKAMSAQLAPKQVEHLKAKLQEYIDMIDGILVSETE